MESTIARSPATFCAMSWMTVKVVPARNGLRGAPSAEADPCRHAIASNAASAVPANRRPIIFNVGTFKPPAPHLARRSGSRHLQLQIIRNNLTAYPLIVKVVANSSQLVLGAEMAWWRRRLTGRGNPRIEVASGPGP